MIFFTLLKMTIVLILLVHNFHTKTMISINVYMLYHVYIIMYVSPYHGTEQLIINLNVLIQNVAPTA